MAEKESTQSIVKNRRATFDYEIERRIEGGLVLAGSEVKSLRSGKVDLSDAYAQVEKGEAWLRQMYIAPFEQAKVFPHEVRRPRKILLHAREILEIQKDVMRGGYTVVPMELYFKKGRIKVLLGIGKGKKNVDKRHAIAKKDAERDARSAERQRTKE
ncbi:MAG: SsrA-binding protein SmpB [Polyangiaceae bacterium]